MTGNLPNQTARKVAYDDREEDRHDEPQHGPHRFHGGAKDRADVSCSDDGATPLTSQVLAGRTTQVRLVPNTLTALSPDRETARSCQVLVEPSGLACRTTEAELL